MPFFGLVWVASCVGCFFPSSCDLFKTPNFSQFAPRQLVAEFKLGRGLRALTAWRTLGLSIVAQADRPVARSQTTIQAPIKAVSPNQTKTTQLPAWLPLLDLSSLPPKTSQAVVEIIFPFSGSSTPVALGKPQAAKNFQPMMGMMHNLLWGLRLIAGSPRLDRAVNAVTISPLSDFRSAHKREPKRSSVAGLGQCMPLQLPPQPNRRDQPALFQVRLREYLIAEVPNHQQATQIVQQLQQLNQTTLNPAQIQPALVQGVPAGKVGDRVLFTVDKEIAKTWSCTPELLAIHWVNNLRIALNEFPLTFIAAQEKMYGLRETTAEISGVASWYGPYFHGRQTATGEIFNQNELTAAHPSLPFDTFLKVINLRNGKSVIVRVNDRGPYVDDRALDLSREAARFIDSETPGIVPVKAIIMEPTAQSSLRL
jgi:rare lipoprotein A